MPAESWASPAWAICPEPDPSKKDMWRGGLATVLVFPLLILLRSLGERTDIIVGKRAGRRATCAAQGLPQVAQVDAIAREAAG